MSSSIRFLFAASSVSLASSLALASLAPAPGFSTQGAALSPGNAFIGGLCVLADGRAAYFDGTSILALDIVTAQSSVLYTPLSFVFGAFLVLEPGGDSLLFGESSFGTITRVPLAGGSAMVVATVSLAYDAAFHPAGGLFVSRGSPSFQATEIVRLDPGSGGIDLIATVPGPSGPLTFSPAGDLFYGESSAVFPAPIGSGTIWSWSAAQVSGAIGPGQLSVADAVAVASNLDAVTDLAFDSEGDLAVCDSIHGKVYALSQDGAPRAPIAEIAGGGATYLAFRDDSSASPARFEPFQPESGGELLVVDSNFSTYSAITRIRPRRPTFTTSPVSPIPAGSFSLSMVDGSPYAWLHGFVAPATMPEIPVFLLGTPLFFGLAPGSIVPIGPFPLDSTGAIHLPAVNPGLGLTVHLQAALIDLAVGPLGTTPPTPLVLQ